MPFIVSSYNILATAYIRSRYYPHVASERLDPNWRIGALVDAVERLAAQILCLQEVENESFTALQYRLGAAGYVGEYAKKAGSRPDGCAVFFDSKEFTRLGAHHLVYEDAEAGAPPSGHVALLLWLQHQGGLIGIANTHLKWDRPEATPGQQIGLRQARQLIAEMAAASPACDAWIACGDFNATPDTATVEAFRMAGFLDPFSGPGDCFTCNSNGVAKRIDYVLSKGSVTASSCPMATIDGATPLPSLEQPSDHVSISAVFDWWDNRAEIEEGQSSTDGTPLIGVRSTTSVHQQPER